MTPTLRALRGAASALEWTIARHAVHRLGVGQPVQRRSRSPRSSAPLTAIVGLLAAYVITRHRFAGRRAFEFLTMVSFAIPGTVIGVSYIVAFNVAPLELTGGMAILVLCFVFSLP